MLSKQVKSQIDRTCTTHLSNKTYAQLDELKKNNKKVPRSSEILLTFIDNADSNAESLSKEELYIQIKIIIENFKLLIEKELQYWLSQSYIHM